MFAFHMIDSDHAKVFVDKKHFVIDSDTILDLFHQTNKLVDNECNIRPAQINFGFDTYTLKPSEWVLLHQKTEEYIDSILSIH